jgi:uncharacterized protein with FMN-binding domain
MRRIVIVSLTTIAAVALLFSYHTSTNSSALAGSAVIRQRGTSGSGSATFTGDVADTRWGPVQVRVTIQGGRITSAEAVQYPDENRRDVQINGEALPILSRQVVQEQSAVIDTVSGATVTSDGYRQSLQSAIDRAHL